jgi:hypothetical protein
MFNLSKNASRLSRQLFKGTEVENKIAAGVLRTIISDITRLYFENRRAKGKGILVFNPEDPDKSRYVTLGDIEDDIALAQEAMNENMVTMLKKMAKVVEKEAEADLALVAMIQGSEITVHLLDSESANERIDQLSNGIIY